MFLLLQLKIGLKHGWPVYCLLKVQLVQSLFFVSYLHVLYIQIQYIFHKLLTPSHPLYVSRICSMLYDILWNGTHVDSSWYWEFSRRHDLPISWFTTCIPWISSSLWGLSFILALVFSLDKIPWYFLGTFFCFSSEVNMKMEFNALCQVHISDSFLLMCSMSCCAYVS